MNSMKPEHSQEERNFTSQLPKELSILKEEIILVNHASDVIESQEGENLQIRRLFERMFENKELTEQFKKDLIKVYRQVLSLDPTINIDPESNAEHYIQLIKQGIASGKTVREIEDEIHDYFNKNGTNKLLFLSTEDRRDTILGEDQKKPWLDKLLKEQPIKKGQTIIEYLNQHTNYKIVDYGIGSGQLAQKISNDYSLEVIGCDVLDYRFVDSISENVHFAPIISGTSCIPNQYANLVTLYNVIHHEANNHLILQDIDRILKSSGQISVIETVPDLLKVDVSREVLMNGTNRNTGRLFMPKPTNRLAQQIIDQYVYGSESVKYFNFVEGLDEEISYQQLELAQDENHLNDHERNRTVTPPSAQVPVPGTYENIIGWLVRFANIGYEIVPGSLQLYGYDMKGIEDFHVGYEFKKCLDDNLLKPL